MVKLKTVAKVALLSVAVAATSAYAVVPGPYVGGQLGWGKTYWTDTDKNSGFAGRIYGGYQFTDNLSAELGWQTLTGTRAYGVSDSRDAVDVVGKYRVTLNDKFGVYGKLGAAYVWESVKIEDFTANTDGKFMPTFGAGATYDFTSNAQADLSWTRIQELGHSSLPSSDMFTVGLSYYFG